MNNQLNINEMKRLLFLCLIVFVFSGCAPKLLPPTVTRHSTLDGYKYVYIMPSSEKSSVVGGVLGGGYGVYGFTTTNSANPMDLISGYFLERGYTRIPEVKPETTNNTLIVSYGETESGYVAFGGYKTGIIIQIISAQTNDIICVCKGEGNGGTNADAVRNAIKRCLDEVFNAKSN